MFGLAAVLTVGTALKIWVLNGQIVHPLKQVLVQAQTAHTATRLATEPSSAASRGGEVVGRVVNAMSEISGSSRRMGDIIAAPA